MNTEEDEFKRIEVEAKRRAAKDKDDDTQVYTSEVAASYSYRCGYEAGAAAAIKEALAQPEQEPVVWMYQDKSTHEVRFQKHMRSFVDHGRTYETPLYTTPPQRTWVGLTNDEMRALASWWPSYDQMPGLIVLAKDIQNSLKERNHG